MNGLAQIVSTFAGTGYLRPAPGTWGSLVALPMAWGLHLIGGFPVLLIASIAVFFCWLVGNDSHDAWTSRP